MLFTGGGPDVLRGSGAHTSAVQVGSLFYVADMELLESTWFGASVEKVEDLRQRVVALRTLGVAYDAQMRTAVPRCQYFECNANPSTHMNSGVSRRGLAPSFNVSQAQCLRVRSRVGGRARSCGLDHLATANRISCMRPLRYLSIVCANLLKV